MNISQQVQQLFSSPFQDPLGFFLEMRTILKAACSQDGEWSPLGPNASQGHRSYIEAAERLQVRPFAELAESLLLEWWDDLGEIQRATGKRVYRAACAVALAVLYLRSNERGNAFRWFLLTYADDLLNRNVDGQGSGKYALQTVYRVGPTGLARVAEIAKECLDSIEAGLDSWAGPAGFADEVVRRLAVDVRGGSEILLRTFPERDLPISRPYFSVLLESARSVVTTADKGETLENVASYLFMLLSGCLPRRNLQAEDQGPESDLVVRNLSPGATVSTDLFGRYFLVECKNWGTKIGAAEVGYFLYRMRLTRARFGIILSREGVTGGDSDQEAARGLIRSAFNEDGTVCIVVTQKDLDDLASGNSTVFSLLQARMEQRRFGLPKAKGKTRRRDRNTVKRNPP